MTELVNFLGVALWFWCILLFFIASYLLSDICDICGQKIYWLWMFDGPKMYHNGKPIHGMCSRALRRVDFYNKMVKDEEIKVFRKDGKEVIIDEYMVKGDD